MSKDPIQILKLHYTGPRRNIGFTFFAAKNAEPITQFRQLFLYEIDAELILTLIRPKYPLPNPESGENLEKFDPCWDNPIPKTIWLTILNELQNLQPQDEPQATFLNEFKQWLQQALNIGDYVTVSGNL